MAAVPITMLAHRKRRGAIRSQPIQLTRTSEDAMTVAISSSLGVPNKPTALMPTDAAAQQLGISVAQLRRIAEKQGVEPDDTYDWGHGRWSGIGYLWSRKTLGQIKRTRRYKEVFARAEKTRLETEILRARLRAEHEEALAVKAARLAAIDAAFRTRYPTAEDALLAACESMHRLNRLASGLQSYDTQRVEIYKLKNAFVRRMHESGYCARVERHIDEKPCWGLPYDTTHRSCCGGTGIYSTQRYYCFYFYVAGREYSWHQPESLVTWPVELGIERAMPTLGVRESALTTADQIEEALAIVRWFMFPSVVF